MKNSSLFFCSSFFRLNKQLNLKCKFSFLKIVFVFTIFGEQPEDDLVPAVEPQKGSVQLVHLVRQTHALEHDWRENLS